MSDQYALCWNNYKKNLSSGFYSLYSRGDFTDVTLSADGQLIQCHRMVLAVCSPYFRNLFEKTPAANHPIVFLKDISYKNLTDLIQFMYSGEVHVKQDDLPNFIAIAESLQIKGLTEFGVNDVDNTNNTKNGEKPPSRMTRASKRASKQSKESDEDIPLKFRKRSRNSRVSKNENENEDPLEDRASTSTSQLNFVTAKSEPILDDSNFDDDNFNSNFDKDDDDHFDDSSFMNTSQHNTNNKPDNNRPSTTDPEEELPDPGSGAPAPVEFFPTKMGGYVMVHDSQIYSLERRGGGHWYWCCNLKGPRRCPARCQTTSQFDSVVIRNSDHNHPSRTAEIERRRLRVTATAGPDDCAEWMRRLDAQHSLKEDRKMENVKEEN